MVQSEQVVSFEPSFRVSGLKPELWDAVTGNIRMLNEYTEQDGRTFVPIKMEAHQSWFIVFTNNVKGVSEGYKLNFPEFSTIREMDAVWTVDFLNKEIGPEHMVTMESLTDWSRSENEKIKYYSGTAKYETAFELSDLPGDGELFIDLGEVEVMASVKINGLDLGGVWMAPYRVNATGHLRNGSNKIEIDVVNLWRNHLIKDKKRSAEERYTWHLVDDIRPDEAPHSSGFLGPVSIQQLNYN